MGEDPPSTEPQNKQQSSPEDAASFWSELKRRKVTRVAITYGVVMWLLIQVAATVFPQLGLPEWAPRMVTLLLLIGFPVAVIIAWAFELTPDGIKTTKAAKSSNSDTEDSKGDNRRRNGLAIAFAAGLPTLVFGSLALILFFGKSDEPSDTSPIYEPDRPHFMGSVAALPIQVISKGDSISSFAEGLHDEFLTQLSALSAFDVVSRTSTLAYREPSKSVSEIGEALGARYVIESSIQEEGSHWRLTVQVIEAVSDLHLDAKTYDQEVQDNDLLYLQKELAWDVAFDVYERLREENPFSEEAIAARDRLVGPKVEEIEAVRKGLMSGGGPQLEATLVDLLEQVLGIDPENQTTNRISLEHRMVKARMSGFNDSALAQLRLAAHKALKFNSDDFQTLTVAGVSFLFGFQRPDLALPLLQEGLRLYEADPDRELKNDLYNNLARAMALTGNAAGGLRVLERAPVEYMHWEFIEHWIPLYTDLRRFEEGIELLEARLQEAKADSNEVGTQRLMDQLANLDYKWTGNLGSARDYYEIYSESLSPYEKARRLLQLGEYDSALEEISLIGGESAPQFNNPRGNLIVQGRALHAQGNQLLARTYFDKAIDMVGRDIENPDFNSNYGSDYALLARLNAFAGHDDKARKAIALAEESLADIALIPTLYDNVWQIARALIELEEYDQACEKMEMLLSGPTGKSTGWLMVECADTSIRTYPKFEALLRKYQDQLKDPTVLDAYFASDSGL